ncbi:MAG: HlyD family efflux transporter periplasmic adaptor subunit [Lewinellaceae bacterium]|nr:HlyD family efflux transporter periplasmic adaptor subunit [Lewinellaceae bacterium]
MKHPIQLTAILALLLMACQPETDLADAYGNFETTEVLVAAEQPGRLLFLQVEEGQNIPAGQLVGLIDTVPLHLQRQRLLATLGTLQAKLQNPQPQIAVLEKQKGVLQTEKTRIEGLIAEKAAPGKQLDDVVGQMQVIDQQVRAAREQAAIANQAILSERAPLEAQIRQLDDQIRRCYITNPISGRVLVKMAEASEMTAPGKTLYKIANLDEMTLRVFVTGDQLPNLALGQAVTVRVDQDAETNREVKGEISWIADQAEFTPKIVQTKEERVNLVYAVKIRVPNTDGRLKIGMPGELVLPAPPSTSAQ